MVVILSNPPDGGPDGSSAPRVNLDHEAADAERSSCQEDPLVLSPAPQSARGRRSNG